MENTPKKILTPAEIDFYKVLQEALGDELSINPKVKLSDVVHLDDSITKALSLGITFSQWKIVFDSNTRQHVDYAIVDPNTLEFKQVIELDDTTHDNPHSECLDYFKNFACYASGIPIYRFRKSEQYNIKEIQKALSSHDSNFLAKSKYDKSEIRKYLAKHKSNQKYETRPKRNHSKESYNNFKELSENYLNNQSKSYSSRKTKTVFGKRSNKHVNRKSENKWQNKNKLDQIFSQIKMALLFKTLRPIFIILLMIFIIDNLKSNFLYNSSTIINRWTTQKYNGVSETDEPITNRRSRSRESYDSFEPTHETLQFLDDDPFESDLDY